MSKLLRSIRGSNVTGEFLVTMLIFSSSRTIWPMYLWIREEWTLHNQPLALFWCICALYYAIWMWLALFLSREYRQYPGMSMDAVFGGLLLAIASALHDADVLSDLSKKGFGWAAWVLLFSACGLVFRNSASFSRRSTRPSEPVNSSGREESLPAE